MGSFFTVFAWITVSMMWRTPLVGFLPEQLARVMTREGHVRILSLDDTDLPPDEMCAWHLREVQSEVVERFKQLLIEAATRLEILN